MSASISMEIRQWTSVVNMLYMGWIKGNDCRIYEWINGGNTDK